MNIEDRVPPQAPVLRDAPSAHLQRHGGNISGRDALTTDAITEAEIRIAK